MRALKILAIFSSGFVSALVLLAVVFPDVSVDEAISTVTNTRSYEIDRDIEPDTIYTATCEADRCRWETFEYIGWVYPPGYVSYRKATQIRRGDTVTIDTWTVGYGKVETEGTSKLRYVGPTKKEIGR